MQDFEIVSPTSKTEALSLLAGADEETRLIAGGTGLLNLVKQRLASPERLVSLHRVEDLAGVEVDGDSIVIGALERLLDLEQHPGIRATLPVMAEALAEVAGPRIRSMATIGGAIAHGDPNQDLPPVLLALDASVVVESVDVRREVPIAEFYRDYYETALAPGEMVTGVRIPLPQSTSRFAYRKFTPGSREDYACVGVCVRLDRGAEGVTEDSRVVLWGVAPTVLRVRAAEELLHGEEITPDIASEAGRRASEASDPVDDVRGSIAYKRRMICVWVKRELLRAAGAE